MFGPILPSWNSLLIRPVVIMWLWRPLILIQRSYHRHGLLDFALDLPLEGELDANANRLRNTIFSLPHENPCRLFVHDDFFWPLGLHLLVWSELRQSPPFTTNERSWNAMVTRFQSHVWRGPHIGDPMKIWYHKHGQVGINDGPFHQIETQNRLILYWALSTAQGSF